MKFKHLAILAVGCALAVGAFTFAGDVLPEDDRGSQTDGASAGEASPSPSDGSVEDEDAPASQGPGQGIEVQARDPGVGVPGKGASPMEMTTNLLGPAPEGLDRVDPSMSLEEAIRQHPAMAEEDVNPDAPTLSTPLDRQLSKLVQAHGILTEATNAASSGDQDARELVPYAAAQLATQAERSAPVFDATSELASLQADRELRLHTEQQPVPPTQDLQTEVDRLYRTLGIPSMPVETDVEDAHERARLLNAVTAVVQATQDAKQMGENVDTVREDIERVNEALADGEVTGEEARLLVDVADLVYDTTMTPLQKRLDALDTLYATANEVAPTLATPTAGHGEDPGLPDDVDQAREETEGEVEDARNETENQVEEARNETENRLDEARAAADEAVQPVRDELANNFVDPLGAVVVLNETDETVSDQDQPEPVQVPGVGTIGSLFPRTPLLVLDRGGDTTYEGIPRSHAGEDTLQAGEDPVFSQDDIPVDGSDTVRGVTSGRGTFFGPFIEDLGDQVAVFYDHALDETEDQAAAELNLVLDTPVQVVVDLAGNDTYTGESGAAHAAGGGTAAVYDRLGHDTYDVERGIGLTQEDGLALVKDFAGDDTFRAERGIGSVIQPFNRTTDGIEFQDRFRYGLGGMGALVAFDGANTYDVGDAGIGIAFYNGTFDGTSDVTTPDLLLPQTVPVALDLAGGAEGFQPTLIDDIPATTRIEKDDGGAAGVWMEQRYLPQGAGASFDHVPFFSGSFGCSIGSGPLCSGGTSQDPAETAGVMLRTTAAFRSYETDLSEASQGQLEVADHNVTLRDPTGIADLIVCNPAFAHPCLEYADLRMHNEIVVSLDGDETYEPPYPLILVDAGDTRDTYVNASPEIPLFDSENDRGEQGPGETTAEQTSTAPMLALDTGGDDTYLGPTGSLNTTALLEELPQGILAQEDPFLGARAERASLPSSASVIVNDEGDNVYEGRVASTYLNLSAPATLFSSIVYDGSGSDTLKGETIAGLEIEQSTNSRGFGDFEPLETGHGLVNLLLMGTDTEDETERNTIEAGAGSLGSVRVLESRADTDINAYSRFTAGASIAGPTDYRLANHSIASVEWCTSATGDGPTVSKLTCPTLSESFSGSPTAPDSALVEALFVGSSGQDRYTLNSTDAIGHVTIDETKVCPPPSPQGTIVTGDVDNPQPQIPEIVTRFAEAAGPDDYSVLDPAAAIPDWRNDAFWEPFSCDGVLDTTAPDGGETQQTVDDETGEELDGTDERPLNETDAKNIDTLAIDNVGQYALGSAALGARGTVEEEAGNRLVRFEPPELCTGPYAIGDEDDAPGEGRPVVGFDVDRCADVDEPHSLFSEDDAIRTDERVTLTTRTDKTVPVSVFGAVNPCDVGRTSGRSLELDVLDTYAPQGNPLAHGTSGCWATLQIKLINQTETQIPSPEFEPLQMDGTGWIDAFAGPVRCGYTDESLQIRCSTDAMPVPLHVDGSDGRNLDRWMLPEGDYEYRMTFHGPIGALLGGQSRLDGSVTIDRQPLHEAGPLDEFPNSPTQTPPGLLTWLGDEGSLAHDASSDLLEGFEVRLASQGDDGEPETLLVRGPLELDRRPTLQPAVCIDGTPYRGDPTTAQTRWLGDRGMWSTTYEAVAWEPDTKAVEDPPEGCNDVDAGNELPAEGLHEVETALYHLDRVGEPERVELPEDATVNRTSVDETDPILDVGPLPMALGLSIEDPAISLDDVTEPEVGDFPDASDFATGTVEVEWPIQVTSHSPIRELTIGEVTDHVWKPNRLDKVLDDDSLVLQRSDGSADFCPQNVGNPEDEPEDPVCEVTLNVTDAGVTTRTFETPNGPLETQTWHRNATLNLTVNVSASPTPSTLSEALMDTVSDRGRLTLDLPSLEAADEAGNSDTLDLDDIMIDFSRPRDLPLPCHATGLGTVTDDAEHPVKVFPWSDDIGHLVVERLVDGEWRPQQVVPEDDLVETDRSCDPEGSGDWVRFTYATDAEPGTTNLHRLRTVAVDEAGNREFSTEFFEFSILFDREDPRLDVTTLASSPSSLEVEVDAGEPVTMLEDATHLVGPDGTQVPPVGVASEPVENQTIRFNGLDAGTDYTLSVAVEDRAGHTNATTANLTSASTVRAALEDVPEIAGDRITFDWSAGALKPTEGGDPQLRVTADALHDGSSCGDTREVREFVAAPIDDPRSRSLTVPIADCPSGNLTLDLVLENGPVDEPLERIHLNTTVLHDTERPVPEIDVDGEVSETGWYTSGVSVSPAGSDDTGIAEAEIVTDQGAVERLDLSQPGVHEVEVHVVDEAGREATDVLEVPIDLAGPSATLVPLDPLPTERNLLTVQVDATDDASGISSMRVLEADGTFGDWLPVVDGSQKGLDIRGVDRLVTEVRDRAGHVSQVSLSVSSLADKPEVSDARVTATGPSTVHVEATLDRALPIEVRAVDNATTLDAHATDAAEQHAVTLEGLPPLATIDVEAYAKLSNGENVRLDELSRTLTLPADQGPPTAVPSVNATPIDDGTVRLEWGAAADDAGVDRYLVQRLDGDTVSEQFSVEDTRLIDQPPAGSTYTYAVKALDLASKAGPWTTSSPVDPTTGLKIVSYEITPEVATEGSPVTITVTVRGPEAPQQAELNLGDERIPLTLQEGGDGVWTYGATMTPSATDSLSPHRITVQLDGETFPSEGAFPGPTVKVLETGEVSPDSSAVPAPGIGALFALVALAAVATRRWSA